MSSDKSAKNTGTRHKARECALHMLFAYDLVRPPKYSLSDYWGELGLEELHKGMTALVWSVTDETAKIERAVSELRSFFKRLEPLEKSTSRTDKLKSITNHIEHLDRDYRAFVRAIEHSGPFDDQEVRRGVRSIRNAFDALKNDFEGALATKRLKAVREDRIEFEDLLRQAITSVDKIDIKWPDGSTQTVRAPGVDRRITIGQNKR